VNVAERLSWFADRLAAAGYLALPCRPCNRQAAITVHELHEVLMAGAAAAAPEHCICAAVLTEEGIVIHGHRHHDALRAAGLAFCRPKRAEDGQGFVTSRGRYVTREEGYQLQVAADIGSRAPGGYRGDRLYSEDLY
jgi:hypothetical protein